MAGSITGSKSRQRQQTQQHQRGSQTDFSRQRVDPRSQQFIDAMRQQGLGAQQMVQGHPGSFIAGPTDAFRTGMGTMERIAGLDPNHQAQQVGAQQVGSPGQVRAGQVRAPAGGPASMAFAPEQVDTGRIGAFFDPFESQVVSGVRDDFQHQRQMADQAARQQATAAGAFGGSRGEVLQAQSMEDINRAEASQLAQVRSGGFSQALGATMDEHQLMQNLGFGAEQSNLNARLAHQQMAMQAQMANQGAGLQAGMANQMARLQAQGMNQQASLQAGMANQQAGLQAQGMDLQGLGLALQGGGQLAQAGELQRQIQQQGLQEPIMRAQLGQDFLGSALGPVGMDSFSQQNFQQWMNQQKRSRSSSFGLGIGLG